MQNILTRVTDEQFEHLCLMAFKRGVLMQELYQGIFSAAVDEDKQSKERISIDWITDGSLPDSDIAVLLCTDVGDVGEAFHDGDDWRWASNDIIGSNRVTAWADLPEGPKP